MPFQNLFLIILIFFLLYFFLQKFRFLSDNTAFSNHKKIGVRNNSPILLGGIFLLIVTLFFPPTNVVEIKVIYILITLLGILSDKNILPNPKIRFTFQISIILSLIYFNNLSIDDLRIDFLNNFLINDYFNVFFTAFCLAVLINGCNFIDGLNGLLSGYLIIVICSLIYVSESNSNINLENMNYLNIVLFSLILFFAFNIFGKVYLGDSGSYLISIILGSILIKFYSANPSVSPFYIAILLWYPAFENLFSLIRRIYNKKTISKPDNRHLHQLIFLFSKSKKYASLKIINPLSSIVILFFNSFSFLFANNFPSQSSTLIIILITNIFFYLAIYIFLAKYLKVKK